ncbi:MULTISPECIES: hypothetical protein [Mycobacterium]|nr:MULTISPECIES: hypothetical protein [Mycobacterium]AFJ35062.1 hypothetical protein W7S_10455 [Mycobacterium sp. MOTT36Y]ELR84805.1 hypothetical protein W7U_06225 [Mycobacterium sp. H4Y]
MTEPHVLEQRIEELKRQLEALDRRVKSLEDDRESARRAMNSAGFR